MRFIASTTFTLALVAVASAGPTATTLDTNMTRFRVNTSTNAEVAIISNPFQSNSLAMDNSGQLYSADLAGNLWNVTAAPIPVGPTLRNGIADLDYANNGLWGFSNFSRELFFYDFGTNLVTYAQVLTGTGSLTMTGVAYQASTGDIYLSGYGTLNTDRLFRVTPSATSATLVGSMAISDALSYFADIDFDASGTLYGMTFYHREFDTINLTTAATTFVSTGPHRDTTAMALRPVPEPASILALAAGLLLLGRKRRQIAVGC